MTKFKVLLVYPNTMMATLIPLSISVLSASLKAADIDVRLFDTTYYRTEERSFEDKRVELLQLRKFDLSEVGILYNENDIYQDLKGMVREYQPDLIGVTLVEDTMDLGLSLIRAIADYPAPVIAGGVHVNFIQDRLLEDPDIDFICVGEGEEALVELCRSLRDESDFSAIPNICYRMKDSTVIKNLVRKPVDLNLLSYLDFDVFEPSRLWRPMQGQIVNMLHVEIQRGCPYGCTYCGAPAIRRMYEENGFNNYYRQKSPDRIITELLALVAKYKPNYINFGAESFLAMNRDDFYRFADLYENQIAMPFWCQTRLETVTEDKIQCLKRMNCANMQFGIEHGNEQFRKKVLNRNISNEQIIKAIKIIEKYQIPYTVNNIIGFPGETRELVFDTINLNRKFNAKSVNCYMFTPYTGTFLRDECVRQGLLEPDARTSQTLSGADIKYDGITKEELSGLLRTFNLYVRFPVSEWQRIEQAEKMDSEGSRIFAELSAIYEQKYLL